VRRACKRLPLAEEVLALRSGHIAACRQQVDQLTHCHGADRLVSQKLVGIEQEAGKAALRAQELAHRFGLVDEVPCAGTDLQGQCKLLGDAREAQPLIPSANGQIQALAKDKAAAQQELEAIHRQRDALAGAPQALVWAEHRLEVARSRVSRFALLAAQSSRIDQSHTALLGIEQELSALGPEAEYSPGPETGDEQSERRQITSTRERIAQQLAQQAQHYREALNRHDGVLAVLPAPFEVQQLDAVAQAMTRSALAVTAAEQAHVAAERDAQALLGLSEQANALLARREQVQSRMLRVEDSLGTWNLFARCMSNDGLIALAIDDAGPALSGLANDLLLACYGPRFTVSILTLVETGKGEQREGFDILVHDGESGDSKSVGLMSGGERVWVNECLTRAVALYLAQHSGRSYDTLFSDEADGALDPERKRMFMAMKREVLRLGGYRREFYVSQTPELTAMADVVIDLDAMRVNGNAHENRASA